MLCVLVLVIGALTSASPVAPGTSTARSPAQIGETLKQLTNQLMDTNATSSDIVTLDTRTPPKIKQQQAKKKPVKNADPAENSHAGVAIPVDEDELLLEATTKKLNFYKLEKPTTNSGLSTWILLSGQTTMKPSRKPVIKPNDNKNVTVVVVDKVAKPVFKKRLTTSTTTTSSTSTSTSGTTSTTSKPATTKMNKIKASILNNAKKSSTSATTTTTTTTRTRFGTRTSTSRPTIETTTTPTTVVAPNTATSNSSSLPMEAKDGEAELDTTTEKTRRTTTKRKKNKNRRRRPSDKTAAATKIDKPPKDKPIGTQLYNYLSREVMPTVGVGLVGLMVTAGLAGYFLYPFGIARRSYEVDRRDKDPHYFYSDEHSGGIAEEEAIGKVIAGMPSNSLYGNFKTPTSRHSFNNHRVIEQSTSFSVGDEATPVAVPEHGPRSLRRRRQLPQDNDSENEIDASLTRDETTTFHPTTTPKPDKVKSLVTLFSELFRLKINIGLQLIHNATEAVSKYVSNVQRRFDEHYKTYRLN